MTLVAAAELGRYGVNVNAIAPVARTRMTEGAFDILARCRDARGQLTDRRLARLRGGCDVTGRVLEIEGGQICVEEGWRHGPKRDLGPSLGRRRGRRRPCAS